MSRDLIQCSDMDELRRQLSEGPHLTKIAAHFGVAYKVVRRWLKELGVEYEPRANRPRGSVPQFGFILTSHSGKRIQTRLYQIWHQMKGRCSNPKHAKYRRYGARGIRVCDEWLDYAAFRTWAVANGYRKGLSIERRDNDGHYESGNCTWIPVSLQQDNTGRVHLLTVDGVTKSLPWWSRHTGIRSATLNSRIRAGWDHKAVVTTPVGAARL